MIVIGDVHGCHKTLMALIKKLPNNRKLCFVGDLIDCGPDSKKVLNFVFLGGHRCVRGNHEDLVIHSYHDDGTSVNGVYLQWMNNGGGATLGSIGEPMGLRNLAMRLPIYIEYTAKNGTEYVISHSYCGEYWKTRNEDYDRFAQEAMWTRDFTGDLEGKINVIGHTPVEHVTHFEDRIMIDTGCFFGGVLSAMDLETGKLYQQQNIEE